MLTKLEGNPNTTTTYSHGSTFTKDSVKPLKLKTCKVCKTKFQPTKPFQKVCGVEY